MGRPKKSDAKHASKATNDDEAGSSKNQGHFFRSLTTTVASMFHYLKDYPDKLRLVNEMGFGALSHLPANNLDQQLLKQIYDRFDIHDNTIYSDAAAVKLTTRKIGDALRLCSTGTINLIYHYVSIYHLHSGDFKSQKNENNKPTYLGAEGDGARDLLQLGWTWLIQ
ncbi:hypothetical protein PIB30_032435, partial [Stylosanthes scabra]|nr:hypothetical protein [Stylosanthes scabra]